MNAATGELFEGALSLPPGERDAFLAAACGGDAALRAELDALLAAHAAAPRFLERLRERVLPPALEALQSGDPLVGRRVARYEILERLGGGGMGVVYRARDVMLERQVALKFLPPHLAADADARERLRREARATSALDHPNIGVVHEIGATDPEPGEAEGSRLFIAMAYHPGITLAARLRNGPLAIAPTIMFATEIADALAAAHRAGVVHRDIKPGNVLVTDGDRIKVVDFGVARVAGSDLTGEGIALGTVAYMSPEQTRGQTVDARTDVWSLGVMLYEMLAGVQPFRGDSEAVVIHGIRHDEPPSLHECRRDVPGPLVRVVTRCLAKDAALRYASGAEVAADLRALAVTAADTAQPSILVLPFVNISADPDNEYFSDGLTDEVITALSHIRALRVISRTSAMRFKRSERDVRTIAREVDVRYVLEGGVRKAGDAVRITARFIDARDDRQLWTRSFAGTLADVFEFQEQVARTIVEGLRIRLSAGESRGLADRPIPDARAYEPYLRARYEAWRFSRDGLERAQRCIDTALAIVGDNELLYSTLGHITAINLEAGIDPDGGARERVDAIAERVFALNPDSARGHFLKAFAAFPRGDMRGALRAGERALALAPDDADTLLLLAYIYAHVGRMGDAQRLSERSLELDPLTPLTHAVQGFIAVMEGRFLDALAPYRRCRDLDPDSPFSAVWLGWALGYARRIDESVALLDAAAARFPETAFAGWAASLAHGLRGDPAGTLAAITPVLLRAGEGSEMFARALSHAYALAGETEAALDWLERAVSLGMLNHRFLAEHDVYLASLRGEPRFVALLDRVRAESATLA